MGTDHCSFDYDGVKTLGRDDFSKIPNGMPGVEHRPVLMYTAGVACGRITAVDMARVLAENPARLFGMYPHKGRAGRGERRGHRGLGPAARWTISVENQTQNVDYTPYEGCSVQVGPSPSTSAVSASLRAAGWSGKNRGRLRPPGPRSVLAEALTPLPPIKAGAAPQVQRAPSQVRPLSCAPAHAPFYSLRTKELSTMRIGLILMASGFASPVRGKISSWRRWTAYPSSAGPWPPTRPGCSTVRRWSASTPKSSPWRRNGAIRPSPIRQRRRASRPVSAWVSRPWRAPTPHSLPSATSPSSLWIASRGSSPHRRPRPAVSSPSPGGAARAIPASFPGNFTASSPPSPVTGRRRGHPRPPGPPRSGGGRL